MESTTVIDNCSCGFGRKHYLDESYRVKTEKEAKAMEARIDGKNEILRNAAINWPPGRAVTEEVRRLGEDVEKGVVGLLVYYHGTVTQQLAAEQKDA